MCELTFLTVAIVACMYCAHKLYIELRYRIVIKNMLEIVRVYARPIDYERVRYLLNCSVFAHEAGENVKLEEFVLCHNGKRTYVVNYGTVVKEHNEDAPFRGRIFVACNTFESLRFTFDEKSSDVKLLSCYSSNPNEDAEPHVSQELKRLYFCIKNTELPR